MTKEISAVEYGNFQLTRISDEQMSIKRDNPHHVIELEDACDIPYILYHQILASILYGKKVGVTLEAYNTLSQIFDTKINEKISPFFQTNNSKVYADLVKAISDKMGGHSQLEQTLFADKDLGMIIGMDSKVLLKLGDHVESKRIDARNTQHAHNCTKIAYLLEKQYKKFAELPRHEEALAEYPKLKSIGRSLNVLKAFNTIYIEDIASLCFNGIEIKHSLSSTARLPGLRRIIC